LSFSFLVLLFFATTSGLLGPSLSTDLLLTTPMLIPRGKIS
jgi:hypothetical protein